MVAEEWASCASCTETIYLEKGEWFSGQRNEKGLLIRTCSKCGAKLVLCYSDEGKRETYQDDDN